MGPGSPQSSGQDKRPLKSSLQNCRCPKIQCGADFCRVPHPACTSTDRAPGNLCLEKDLSPLVHTPSVSPPKLKTNVSLWSQTEQQLIIKSLLRARSLFQDHSFRQHLCWTAAVQSVLTLSYEYRTHYYDESFQPKTCTCKIYIQL